MSRAFCTLFDSNYLTRGLVMLRSLKQWHPQAVTHVLCMDDAAYRLLGILDLPDVHRVRLAEVEDEALLAVKPQRSVAEYCWTLAPGFPAWLMAHRAEISEVIYLDADMMFFSPVQPLLDECAGASITIIEHRFQTWNRDLLPYGRFNVEWVGFRRDPQGQACLDHWRDQCLEWCYARLEDGKMGDQKYLDAWPAQYAGVHIIQHQGAGVAPWNFSNHPVRAIDGVLHIGDQPLVFYHFHQFQWLSDGTFDGMSRAYSNGQAVPMDIYAPYFTALKAALAEVRFHVPGFSGGISDAMRVRLRRAAQAWLPAFLKNGLKRLGA